jgi:hypothetical protein
VNVTDWSRDGRLLAFSSRSEKTRDDLWLLPTESDRTAALYLQRRPMRERASSRRAATGWPYQ